MAPHAPAHVRVDLDGGWVFTFDPTTGRAALADAEEFLAVLPGGRDQVHAFAESRVPARLALPEVDLDGHWDLLWMPLDGTLLLHNPYGTVVGRLSGERGFRFRSALRDALV